jgi:RNA polymerase sigma-70 factor, ECF subfamily
MSIPDTCGVAVLESGHPGSFACEIAARFGERLLQLARRKLDGRLTARIDEQDVFQSVLRSFFDRFQRGHFALESWEDVWALLAVMTTRKCVRQSQVHFAGRRDIRRDVNLSSALEVVAESGFDHGHKPEHAALLAETSERLFDSLTDREKDVLALALAGRTVEEIGVELGRTQRTVRRLLVQVRERLERMAREAA